MRVTLPAPVAYLPENLLILFERPGRELTVRVIEVEGKTLTLEAGGERFQARLAGALVPEDFRPGETVRVRVLSAGPPVVLHLIEGSGVSRVQERLADLVRLIQGRALPVPEGPLVSERPDLSSLLTFLLQAVGERPEEDKAPRREAKAAETPLTQTLLHLWKGGGLILPFFFADRLSWGFLEADREKERPRERYIYLRLFLGNLGLMEAFLRLQGSQLKVDFLFSREEALTLARKEVINLRRELAERGFWPEISLEKAYHEPGALLAREG